MELYEQTAASLHALFTEKKASAAEITEAFLARTEKTESKVGAYITQTAEAARAKAAQEDEKRAAGEETGPLAGVPVALKDNLCTQGVLTSCASKMLYDFVPPYSATAVEKLAAAGAIFTGKTNMDEFAMGSSCETSYFKKTHNPRGLDRVPGGSSGGSAAAVAAGMAPLALGSDTGGSIRQPAALCGVVGLKPTYGAVSRYGLVAFASSLDQIGPFARTADDAALLFDVIKGHDPHDATSTKKEQAPVSGTLTGDVKGLRIGIPKAFYGEGVDDAVKAKVLDTAKALEKAGAKLTDIDLPSTKYALSAYYILACAEASSNLARFDGVKYGYRAAKYEDITSLYENSRSEGFGDEVKRRIMLGTFVLSSGYYDAYYHKAKLTQRLIRQEYAKAFEACDVIATPTSPVTAFRLGERTSDPLQMYAADICTVPVNIAGLPAVSVPCGEVSGLPVGFQLIGRRFDERTILNAAKAVEMLCGTLAPAAL